MAFNATPWSPSGNVSLGMSPLPDNTRTYSFGGGGRSYTAPTLKTSSLGSAYDSYATKSFNTLGGGGGSGSGDGFKIGTNTSGSDALALSQQQLKNDSHLMGEAFKYRTKEADQQFMFRTKGADQDSGLRMKEADQKYGFDRGLADQQYGFNRGLAEQQFGFATQRADQDSTNRMREASQQEGFNRLLQFENNTAKERMQRWGLDHETNMFNLRDKSQKESMRTAALRAARAFQGKIPTNV